MSEIHASMVVPVYMGLFCLHPVFVVLELRFTVGAASSVKKKDTQITDWH